MSNERRLNYVYNKSWLLRPKYNIMALGKLKTMFHNLTLKDSI